MPVLPTLAIIVRGWHARQRASESRWAVTPLFAPFSLGAQKKDSERVALSPLSEAFSSTVNVEKRAPRKEPSS